MTWSSFNLMDQASLNSHGSSYSLEGVDEGWDGEKAGGVGVRTVVRM